MPVDIMKQDVESIIDKTYQEMNSQDSVAIISQIITNRVHHSHHYSLSNYSLENKRFYYCGKLYLPNIESLCLQIL